MSLLFSFMYPCLCFQTILLQDKQQKNYCVSCQELDSDIDKDNPGKRFKKSFTFYFLPKFNTFFLQGYYEHVATIFFNVM